eukprot:CAMPEP_0197681602 /NCGR_PEP_ID=MMETSP1338-20131121/95188_1 /TAXON_ID=43686 ORGANISM="Pelagodinium beii, Strain RCC1491" /NCGR_SAMPLE_ID=MMETSP1338 /ASSEMBLY_ACC=CAM_ASM_000754 /LENGTH=58 /DNA_ID=CAMNT_0043262957 /DNA_START=159 /DNA_END=332 /DNA_ORIENTATION=-
MNQSRAAPSTKSKNKTDSNSKTSNVSSNGKNINSSGHVLNSTRRIILDDLEWNKSRSN